MRFIASVVMGMVVCGCSSSAYDAAYTKRLADYQAAGEFAPLRPEPVALADGRLSLRLPAVLANQLDGGEEPKRAKPPFIDDFPGFVVAYEGMADAADIRFPLVLTVGLVPAGERRKEEVAEAILRQVRKDEEFGKAAWQKGREVVDAAGEARKWDVLELAGPQPFVAEKAGIMTTSRIGGTTEVWLSADPGQKASVILAFRVPEEAAGKLPLPALSTLTARTVRHTEP
jgi:hypothetical protein